MLSSCTRKRNCCNLSLNSALVITAAIVAPPCVPNQIRGLSTCERKVLRRKTFRTLPALLEDYIMHSHVLTWQTDEGQTLNHARDSRPSPLHPLFQKRNKSLPERYYWICPIASAASLDVQGRRKTRSDTATFIQDRGQVPFEPQIQRTRRATASFKEAPRVKRSSTVQ
jgi:hypothetical protein